MTTEFEDGPFTKIVFKVEEEDEGTKLAREIMEEPLTVMNMRVTMTLRTPMDYVYADLVRGLKHPDGSSVKVVNEVEAGDDEVSK